jgi:hypothetical protein
MKPINITDFKQNIGSYFDTLIAKPRQPLILQRRKHFVLVLSLDGLSDTELKQIQNIREKNADYTEVQDKEWVNVFNKITGTKQKNFIL